MLYRVTSPRRPSLRQLFVHGAVWASLTGTLSAQEPTPATVSASGPEDRASTNAAFQAGLDALAHGRDREAAEAFREAYAQDANPAALMNQGIAYTNLQKPHAAVQALEGYIAHADPSRDASTISAVKQEVQRLRQESGRIGLHLIPQHARVELDAEPVDVSSGELLASPGRHTIAASADGYTPFSQTIDVVAGQFTLEIELRRRDLSVAEVTTDGSTTPSAPTALAEASEEPDGFAEGKCALSSVCVGPVFALLGPPNLLGGGLHARIGDYLGLGVDYQVLPTLNLNPIAFGASLVSANARVYPFGGAFFLSGGVGYQSYRGQIHDGAITISAKTSFPALMANIGFMGKSGFVLGADLGLLFPLSTLRASVQDDTGALAQSAIPQADIETARAKAENSVNKALGSLPLLVQVNLLRVGYMF